MPVYMLILVLGIATMFTTHNIENWYYAVPVFNTALALQGILTGDVSVMQYAVTLAETLILGVILITVIAKAFGKIEVVSDRAFHKEKVPAYSNSKKAAVCRRFL